MSAPLSVSQFISLLLALGGVGVEDNRNAPTAAEVMRYAPAEFDYMGYVDAEAIVPRNYLLFQKAAGGAGVPAEVVQAAENLRDGRESVRTSFGFDPVSDLKSMALWVSVPKDQEPELYVAVRGSFPQGIAEKIGPLVPKGEVALASDGVLLVGPKAWVTKRRGKGWKPVASKSVRRAQGVFRGRPFFAFLSAPGSVARGRLTDALGSKHALAEIATGHSFASLSLSAKGVSWEATLRSKEGYDRTVTASEGIIDLLRAGQYGTRGLARIAAASLASYRHIKAVDEIYQSRKELLKLVFDMTGKGDFAVRWQRKAKARTVSVQATGTKLSDVLGAAALAPVVGAWLLYSTGSESPAPPAVESKASASPPPRRGGLRARDIYREERSAFDRLLDVLN